MKNLLLNLSSLVTALKPPQVARAAVRLRGIHEKLVPALGSVIRESCWTEEEDALEERAHWVAVRKETETRLAVWLRAFMAAIRNLELGLMMDEAATIGQAVATLPPAQKTLFANVENMLEELKREDS